MAGQNSGGLFSILVSSPENYSARVDNCIFWENQDISNMDDISQIAEGLNIQVYRSCIQGWKGRFEGQGNIASDPLFVDADGPDKIFGTPDDDLRLSIYSPCIDAGDNSAVLTGTMDLAGGIRFQDIPWIQDTGEGSAPVVDMGAYETNPQSCFLVNPSPLQIVEGSSGTIMVSLALDPGAPVDVAVSLTGDPDVSLESDSTLHFDSSNYSIPQVIILSAMFDNDYIHGQAALSLLSPGIAEVYVSIYEQDSDPAPEILYVDSSAHGANTGTSWADAFPDLQQALQTARIYPAIQRIYIAQGIYRPTTNPHLRNVSFELVSGISLYGGFPTGGSAFEDRDFSAFPTILSGDTLGNDVLSNLDEMKNHPSRNDNSFHVVRGTSLQNGTVLDGYIISGGHSDLSIVESTQFGSGLCLTQSSMLVSNSIFKNNISVTGGAISSESGNLQVQHCTFQLNGGLFSRVDGSGSAGGVYIGRGSADFESCLFENNITLGHGGAVLLQNSAHGIFTDCVFRDNKAGSGGGAKISKWDVVGEEDKSDGTFISCVFQNNSANEGGGLSFNSTGQGVVHNGIFEGNVAKEEGGGILLGRKFILEGCLLIRNSAASGGGVMGGGNADSQIQNSVFLGNTADDGGGLYTGGTFQTVQCIFAHNLATKNGGGVYIYYIPGISSDPRISYCTFLGNLKDGLYVKKYCHVNNCILWANQGILSPIQAGTQSEIDVNYSSVENWKNQFPGVGTGSWNPMFVDPDNPDLLSQDFHLSRDSGCIDMGNPDDPFEEEPQPNGGRVNLGRYGGTSEATSTFDDDGDGYSNPQETRWGLNPHSADTDDDSLSDAFEISYDGDPVTFSPYDPVTGQGGDLNAALADSDGDGLDDYRELYDFDTNPIKADSDSDGLSDGLEIAAGTEPLNPDTDGDGIPDGWEVQNQFNPLEPSDAQEDADSDGLNNRDEFLWSCNPRNEDTDGDQMPDGWEVAYALKPLVNDALIDLDGDRYTNLSEYLRDSFPNSADSLPRFLTFTVDDDAPNDPGPGDPTISDPLADGSPEHPYDSIQKGIDRLFKETVVLGKDTILVRPGIFTGVGNRLIDIHGGFTIRSENGPSDCVIDCQNQGDGFIMSAPQGHEVIVEGFSILNVRRHRLPFGVPLPVAPSYGIVSLRMDQTEFGSAQFPGDREL